MISDMLAFAACSGRGYQVPDVVALMTLSCPNQSEVLFEERRPLLPMRRQPFPGLGAAEAVELHGQRCVERRSRHAEPIVERVLCRGYGHGRPLGELRCDRQ